MDDLKGSSYTINLNYSLKKYFVIRGPTPNTIIYRNITSFVHGYFVEKKNILGNIDRQNPVMYLLNSCKKRKEAVEL